MKVQPPLRGIGPSTFLSYSFADRTLAARLAEGLESRGLRVHREDESSLLGKPLSETIARRIGDREFFVQLLTRTSNASAWVRKELDWALERRRSGRAFGLVQVVVDREGMPDDAPRADFEDAGAGIDDALLDRVARRALETVRLLPMASDAPFEFERTAVEDFLVDAIPGGRRVVVDSDGLLPTAADALVSAAGQVEPAKRPQVEQHFAHLRERMLRRLTCVDAVAPRLFAELNAQLRFKGPAFPACAVSAVQRFCRLVLAPDWLELHRLLPRAACTVLGRHAAAFDRADAARERAQRVDPDFVGLGDRLWRAAGECARYDDFTEVRLFRGDTETSAVFPKAALGGAVWRDRIRAGERLSALVSPEVWATFGVPQVAAAAVAELAAAPPGPAGAPDPTARFGWSLAQYGRLGL